MRRALASTAVLLLSATALVGCGLYGSHGSFHGVYRPHMFGVGRLLLFALQVWGVVDVLRRADLRRGQQALWALGILFVPLFGVLAYVLFGRATRS